MAHEFTIKIELTPGQRQQIARAAGWDLSELELKPEEWKVSYRERWNADAEPIRVGRSLVIKPIGAALDAADRDHVILLDPGEAAAAMVFGTGAHPTTELAIALLEEWITPGDRVLDVGTGSGILALAAARLGAREVLALDINSAAVAVARHNVVANGLAGVVQVREGSVDAAAGPPYDLVVANILVPVIRKLAPALATLVRPAGLLIISGIVALRSREIAAALRAEGFHLEQECSQGDWRALVLRRVDAEIRQ